MSSNGWTWSAAHNDYYYAAYDGNGQIVYIWAKQAPAVPSDRPVEEAASAVVAQQGNADGPADPVPLEVRSREPNFINGTPGEGWYNRLDSSYRMRTGSEARQFFKLGRVFAMLYTEPASGAYRHGNDDAFTTLRFGDHVYTQIRRFVVVSVRKNFVHACAISTYKGCGTLKNGCDPREHAVVYNTGINPESCYLDGEKDKGLYKEPIQVRPADQSSDLQPTSRIRFGKIYSIEWNVKVKDIGRVVAEDLSALKANYHEENNRWDYAY